MKLRELLSKYYDSPFATFEVWYNSVEHLLSPAELLSELDSVKGLNTEMDFLLKVVAKIQQK